MRRTLLAFARHRAPLEASLHQPINDIKIPSQREGETMTTNVRWDLKPSKPIASPLDRFLSEKEALKKFELFKDIAQREEAFQLTDVHFKQIIDLVPKLPSPMDAFENIMDTAENILKTPKEDWFETVIQWLMNHPQKSRIQIVKEKMEQYSLQSSQVYQGLCFLAEIEPLDNLAPYCESEMTPIQVKILFHALSLKKEYSLLMNLAQKHVSFVDANDLNIIVKSLKDANELTSATKLFEQVSANVKPLPETVSLLLKMWIDDKNLESALELYENCATHNLLTRPVHYSYGVFIHVKLKHWDKVLECFNLCQSPMDMAVYEFAIQQSCQDEQFDLAHTLLQHLKSQSLKPSLKIYETLIPVLLQQDRLEEAFDLFMIAKSQQTLSLVILSHIMQAVGDDLDKSTLTTVWKLVDSKRYGVPTAKVYEIAIHSFSKCGDLDTAHFIFEKSHSDKIVLDTQVVMQLIDDCLTARRPMLAGTIIAKLCATTDLQLKEQMLKYSNDWQRLIGRLLPSEQVSADLGKSKELTEKREAALAIYRQLAMHGAFLNETTLKNVMKAYHMQQDLVGCVKAWTLAPKSMKQSSPEMVDLLLSACKDLGKEAMGKAVVEMVLKDKLKLTHSSLESIFSIMARHGWHSEILQVMIHLRDDSSVKMDHRLFNAMMETLELQGHYDAFRKIKAFSEVYYPSLMGIYEERKDKLWKKMIMSKSNDNKS
jgi:hypothetical protein